MRSGAPAVTAQEALTLALVELLERDQRTPCQRVSVRDRWTSEDQADRVYAAAACRMCPVLPQCRAAADEADERFGVWAGTDRTRTPRRKASA